MKAYGNHACARARPLSFRPLSFRPLTDTQRGDVCHGVQLRVTDAEALRPLDALEDGLTGSDDVRGLVEGWRDRDEAEASWARAARAHAAVPAPWVLYGPRGA